MSHVHARSLLPAIIRCLLICCLLVVTPAIATASPQAEQPPACPAPSSPRLLDDYLYGYAPVVMWATQSLMTAVPDATSSPGFAPINQFARLPTTAQPGRNLIPRPNADTLYTLAWLNLQKEPLILHVPDTAGRYYLMPLYDAYSNEFASIGPRTTGTGADDFAIVGPLWRGTVPAGTQIVRAPTSTVWIIGRTLVRGAADLDAARAVTAQFQLVPLSAYPDFLATGTYTPPTNVPFTPPNRELTMPSLVNSAGLSKPVFFDVLAGVSLRNPPPLSQARQALALVADGFVHQADLTSDVVDVANCVMLRNAASNRIVQNGWSLDLQAGSYSTDYTHRAATARFGLGANIAADAVYPSTTTDATGAALTGTSLYAIHFPAGQMPPVNGFWSLTAYDENGFLVQNAIRRYSIGSETGLVPNADGSIDILLQTQPPATLQSNWLPVPPGPFNLTLRLYWPDQLVLDGSYVIPPVQRRSH